MTKLPAKFEDLFGGGVTGHLLMPSYAEDTRVIRLLEKRQKQSAQQTLTVDFNGYKVPLGVKIAARTPLLWCQIVNRYPWAVVVVDVDGRRKRRLCETLGGAVKCHHDLLERFPSATVVSRQRGYDVPSALRNRIPKGWFWCPYCMKPRRFKRLYKGNGRPQTFSTQKKFWSEKRQKYVWKVVDLALMQCPLCHSTNRDPAFRRSNQPFSTRKVKKGATRIRRSQ